jgi:hypothetical protein
MQVWIEVYGISWKPKELSWRIVVDTRRDTFTVVDKNDREVAHQPGVVCKRGDIYAVLDVPYLPYLWGYSIRFRVLHMPPTLEILEGASPYKHVVYADGWKVAEKPFYAKWTYTKKTVPPPNPLALPKLAKYFLMARTKVYMLR